MEKPNYIIEIESEKYHQAAREGQYLSSHLLADFRACPKTYHDKMAGLVPPADSAAFAFGRALHTLVLEGIGKFDEEYFVSDGPVNPKTGETYGKLTKAYREWAAQQKVAVVGEEEFRTMSAIKASVTAHEGAATILSQGFAEGTVRAEWCGMACQTRMDWFDPERMMLADLKTIDTLDAFVYQVRKFGYLEQLAFYRDVLEAASGENVDSVYFIGVEKKAPYRCGVWKVTDAALDAASERNRAAVEELKACSASGVWPTRYEETRVIDLEDRG